MRNHAARTRRPVPFGKSFAATCSQSARSERKCPSPPKCEKMFGQEPGCGPLSSCRRCPGLRPRGVNSVSTASAGLQPRLSLASASPHHSLSKKRKKLLHGPMHHWCGAARCACDGLRLRRSRFARNENQTRSKRELRASRLPPGPGASAAIPRLPPPWIAVLHSSRGRQRHSSHSAQPPPSPRRELSAVLSHPRAFGGRWRGRISFDGFSQARDRRR